MLNVSCHCRNLKAVVNLTPSERTTRLVCYCPDCQAYARHLGQADSLLDEYGGTDLIQMSPALFRVKGGKEHLANLQLSDKGIYRWYARCCNTPICNTPTSPAMPYLGLISANVANAEKVLQEQVGPVSYGVGAGQQHPLSAPWPVAKGFGAKGLFGTLIHMGRWRLRGDHERSELIDAASGEPVVAAHVLSAEERAAAYQL